MPTDPDITGHEVLRRVQNAFGKNGYAHEYPPSSYPIYFNRFYIGYQSDSGSNFWRGESWAKAWDALLANPPTNEDLIKAHEWNIPRDSPWVNMSVEWVAVKVGELELDNDEVQHIKHIGEQYAIQE